MCARPGGLKHDPSLIPYFRHPTRHRTHSWRGIRKEGRINWPLFRSDRNITEAQAEDILEILDELEDALGELELIEMEFARATAKVLLDIIPENYQRIIKEKFQSVACEMGE